MSGWLSQDSSPHLGSKGHSHVLHPPHPVASLHHVELGVTGTLKLNSFTKVTWPVVAGPRPEPQCSRCRAEPVAAPLCLREGRQSHVAINGHTVPGVCTSVLLFSTFSSPNSPVMHQMCERAPPPPQTHGHIVLMFSAHKLTPHLSFLLREAQQNTA